MRSADLGIRIGAGEAGPEDAITDVAGVRVGHVTLVEGEGPLVVGEGPIRTGVTVIVPHPAVGQARLFAGCHRLNGNGELTGLEWIRENGVLTTPIALTNTHSVGVVRDALIAAALARGPHDEVWWSLPVVGETWDGVINDVNGFHVRAEHVERALAAASDGPVQEGNVGGGTGMICHGFKGGIGTASRRVDDGWIVGVLVQANHGRRLRLSIDGVPVGREIPAEVVPLPGPRAAEGAGSIIGIVATDAPLLPHQLERLAQRAALGVGRVGGAGEHSSGDLFLAFATGNADAGIDADGLVGVRMVDDGRITPLFAATIEATEEAIVNALIAAETMTGRDGVTAHALPHDLLLEAMRRYGRAPD